MNLNLSQRLTKNGNIWISQKNTFYTINNHRIKILMINLNFLIKISHNKTNKRKKNHKVKVLKKARHLSNLHQKKRKRKRL